MCRSGAINAWHALNDKHVNNNNNNVCAFNFCFGWINLCNFYESFCIFLKVQISCLTSVCPSLIVSSLTGTTESRSWRQQRILSFLNSLCILCLLIQKFPCCCSANDNNKSNFANITFHMSLLPLYLYTI